jgi:hypothetical protein
MHRRRCGLEGVRVVAEVVVSKGRHIVCPVNVLRENTQRGVK